MKIAIVHGYLLKGTGSNLYVANLCRTLCSEGHRVLLFSQEPHPEKLDFISGSFSFDESNEDGNLQFEKNRSYPGSCDHYRPNLGGLLPVYVFDHYPGYTVKEFPDLTKQEIESYIEKNQKALYTIINREKPDLLISQHTIMQPVYSSRALSAGYRCKHLITIHGSALNFSVRKSALLRQYALEAIEGSDGLVFVSNHSLNDFLNYFSELKNLKSKCRIIPAGVNTELFQPVENQDDKESLVNELISDLKKTSMQSSSKKNASKGDSFYEKLKKVTGSAEINELIAAAREKSDIWSTDEDAAQKLNSIDWAKEKVILYYGKYYWTKGIHLLIAAAPLILARHPQTRFILTGFGSTRHYLEALTGLLDQGRIELFLEMLKDPLRFDPEGTKKAEHIEGLFEYLKNREHYLAYSKTADGNLGERIIFTGIMDHQQLRKLIPCSDLTVAPSIFPESFGMVAVEALACGIIPLQTYHSGFADVVDVYEEAFSDIIEKTAQKRLYLDENLVLALSENINNMLDYLQQVSTSSSKAIKEKAHQLAKNNFSWKAIAGQYLKENT